MKTFTNLTIAALAFIALNSKASANRVHTLDDIHEAEEKARKAAFVQRRLALKDPKVLAKMQAELNVADAEQEAFPGKGHRLGGDKYVNRLLGIDHKEGKRLARLAKKQAKRAERAAHKAKQQAITEREAQQTTKSALSLALGGIGFAAAAA